MHVCVQLTFADVKPDVREASTSRVAQKNVPHGVRRGRREIRIIRVEGHAFLEFRQRCRRRLRRATAPMHRENERLSEIPRARAASPRKILFIIYVRIISAKSVETLKVAMMLRDDVSVMTHREDYIKYRMYTAFFHRICNSNYSSVSRLGTFVPRHSSPDYFDDTFSPRGRTQKLMDAECMYSTSRDYGIMQVA